MIETEKFIDLVKRMRQAQKEYFRTRDRRVMQHAICLEGAVDKCIMDYDAYKKEHPIQMDLFADNDGAAK